MTLGGQGLFIRAPQDKKKSSRLPVARKLESRRVDHEKENLACHGDAIYSLCLLAGHQERIADVAFAQNASFYEGKTIRIIVGSESGGLYDLWARLFAKHMPKHIPGNPNMIVQNMPGAGGLTATNYLYGLTKADGLTLGMLQAHRYMQQLTGLEEAKFDLRKFHWIGTMEKTEVMFFIRADAPYKSFDDVLKSG